MTRAQQRLSRPCNEVGSIYVDVRFTMAGEMGKRPSVEVACRWSPWPRNFYGWQTRCARFGGRPHL
jgi:hypothetical protein